MAGDYIPPNVPLYLTPDSIPVGRFCRTFRVPDSPAWVGLLDGVVSELMNPEMWREFGELTPEEAAEVWTSMVLEAWQETACPAGVPTPYWDEASDLQDEADASVQTWYGIFDGTFHETVENFVIAGFVAYAGGIGAAVRFLTIAPAFRLAWKTGDVGGIIRVFIDGADAGTVDTYSASEGVIERDYVGDPDEDEHEIIMVLEELP